jgi:hypothetical protein
VLIAGTDLHELETDKELGVEPADFPRISLAV